jgi:HSP20 family protein
MEEKEKKLRPLHLRIDEGKIIVGSEDKKTGTKKEISSKVEDVKKGASEKKEDISNQINEIKKGASEKKEDIEENVGKAKKEVEEKKEKLEKDSKKEGMTPAEKILNDIVKKFQQGTGQINEAISDYTTEPETSKKPKMALKPLVDVLETNDTITLIADISGVKKEDIDIGISKNSVEITTMYKEEPELEDAKFTQKERSYGKTHRTIALSTEIKVKKAKAKYKACTLTITLPKKVKDIIKVKIED